MLSGSAEVTVRPDLGYGLIPLKDQLCACAVDLHMVLLAT